MAAEEEAPQPHYFCAALVWPVGSGLLNQGLLGQRRPPNTVPAREIVCIICDVHCQIFH